jgi:hypothetical protein
MGRLRHDSPNELISNEALRQAYLRARSRGRDEIDIVLDLGWRDRSGRPDTVRLRRSLGLSPDGGKGITRQRVTYRVAVAITRAIGADPVEVGI